MSAQGRRPRPAVAAAVVAVVVLAALAFALPDGGRGGVSAQTPPTPAPTDAQVLAVEQQLLCPLCVNERLDVCALAICDDMRRVIRERLAQGSTPEEIILYFESRYGPRVRARLPREGFNLLLFGWVGGAVAATAGAAAYALYSMRRAARRRAATASTAAPPPDERWLDAQINAAPIDEPPVEETGRGGARTLGGP